MTRYTDIKTGHEVWALLFLMKYGVCVGPVEILRQSLGARNGIEFLQPRIERPKPEQKSEKLKKGRSQGVKDLPSFF